MTVIVNLPSNLSPQAWDPEPVFLSRSGGRTLTGRENIVATDAGYWTMTLTIPISDKRKFRIWRGIKANLEGRTNILRVGVFDCVNTPAALSPYDWQDLFTPVPHSDDAFFDDGSGYLGSACVGVVDQDVPARSTSVTILVNDVWPIYPGHYFSVGDRLHIVKTVTNVSSPNTTLLTFWPPTREEWIAGRNLDFDRPSCVWRLTTDDSGGMGTNLPAMTNVVVDLIEALP